MNQGNFSSFQYYDNKINGYLEDAWNAFQTLKETKNIDAFKFLAENDINYADPTWDPIWVDIIDAMKIGHNNATLAVTMRNMQSIAKDGWDAYAARQTKKDDGIKALWPLVQGVKYDDKCQHGHPYYACMPCSH